MSVSPIPLWRCEVLESVGSTQDLLKERARTGAPEGLVVQALEQRAGRGRRGNVWTSPKGNLYMSVLLRPPCLAEQAGQLAFVAALAAAGGLEPFAAGRRKTLKWPNDVLLEGRKCAGILLETGLADNRLEYVAVGIGVNVAASPEGRAGLGQDGNAPQIEAVRDRILAELARYYSLWLEKGFAEIRPLWLKQAEGLSGPVTARLPDAELSGTFEGLDESGALILADGKGLKRLIRAGEVFFGQC